MYYMQVHTFSQPRWSSKGLLGLLRATLPAPRRMPVAATPVSRDRSAPPRRLDNHQLRELASHWRLRSTAGDEGANSVADALELVAARRANAERRLFQAAGERLTAFMQLN